LEVEDEKLDGITSEEVKAGKAKSLFGYRACCFSIF
jgi:hypothetical protein